MSQTQQLDLKQSQSMVMTMQMQQSIKMLQLSSVELSAYIANELEKNPLLTTQDEETSEDVATNDTQQQESAELPDLTDIAKSRDALIQETNENNWPDAPSSTTYEKSSLQYERTSKHSDKGFDFEQNSQIEKNLKELATDQVQAEITDPFKKIIALHLADLLEENGYITKDLAEIAELLRCDRKIIESILCEIQSFIEPAGIFARSLSECLALQLQRNNHFDPAMAILLDHLDLMATQQYPKLRKLCGVSKEDLADMIAEIKALDPKPGSHFNADLVQTVQPDIFLKKDSDGKWRLELNNDVLPKVLINRKYHAQIVGSIHNKQEKQYLSEQLSTANWLIRSLDQRANTILKVATEIVAQQEAFFEYGIHHLRPLSLRHIATAIDMHESTVSRVTNNKYIATPYGLYELRYFFSSGVSSSFDGEELSSTAIKHQIKQLIEEELPAKILSDDKLAEILQKRNINIARRTVAKYREALHIPTSAERKRQKRQSH